MAAVMARMVSRKVRPVVEDYLKLVDVRKEFDGFVAVDDTNLSIARARFLPCWVVRLRQVDLAALSRRL